MYFAIRRSDDGQYWWRAVGDNNEIMAASELMTSKQSCEHSIRVIQAQAAERSRPRSERGPRCGPAAQSCVAGAVAISPFGLRNRRSQVRILSGAYLGSGTNRMDTRIRDGSAEAAKPHQTHEPLQHWAEDHRATIARM